MRFPQANTPVNLHLFRNSQQLLVEPVFLCNNLIIAAYDWLEAVHDNDLFKKNMENFMNLYSLSFY